jgi:hypothetical protein
VGHAATLIILMAALAACGGNSSNFTNSVYIEIRAGGSLQPQAMGAMNGYRVVFLNHDSVAHAIHWDAPLSLSATAQANDRAWFDLPTLPVGTVLHYHLDSSGPSGTVTVAQTLSWPPTAKPSNPVGNGG